MRFFFHRKKITAFGILLANTMLGERLKKIKAALARLDSLNYETKENKKEVLALCGELAGMTKALGSKSSEFKECHDDFLSFANIETKLTEPKKRKISEELHSLLDEKAVNASLEILGNGK